MRTTEQKYSNIFNKDFFPTPKNVIELMQIDCRGLNVLEPSAGKGDIIDYLKEYGAKEVQFCEINNELSNICKSKARFLKNNFLEVEKTEISHINLIVMNPPFSEAKKHILHAWSVAPDGCQIISLCNSDTLGRWDYSENTEIHNILKNFGNEYELGQCFTTADRKTDVNISCIHLFKPCDNTSTNFEGFFMDVENETPIDEGLIKYDEIQSLVNSYMSALKCFDEFEIINERMKNICAVIGMNEGFKYELSYNNMTNNKIHFSKELQRKSWNYIFNKMKIEKYVTRGVMADINKFIETQTKTPFTRRNIYKMIEIIFGTREQSLNKALIEAVDNFTRHTNENRFGVEGWKTNEGHLLNKKFIINYIVKPSYCNTYLQYAHNSNSYQLEDLIKVICNITGVDYNNTTTLQKFIFNIKPTANKWYQWGFFYIKAFKKGTLHLKFIDDKVWEQLNRNYAKLKGHTLPEKI